MNGKNTVRKRRFLLSSSSKKVRAASTPLPASIARLETLLDQKQQPPPPTKPKPNTIDGPTQKKIKMTIEQRSIVETQIKAAMTAKQAAVNNQSLMKISTQSIKIGRRHSSLSTITTSQASSDTNTISREKDINVMTKRKIPMRSLDSSVEPAEFRCDLAARKGPSTVNVNVNTALMQACLSNKATNKTKTTLVSKTVQVTKASQNEMIASSSAKLSLNIIPKAKSNRRPSLSQRQPYEAMPLPKLTLSSTSSFIPSRSLEPKLYYHSTPSQCRSLTSTLVRHPNDCDLLPPIQSTIHKVASTGKVSRSSTIAINDNFVRLNLKNNAGACRGARNKSKKVPRNRRSFTTQPDEQIENRDVISCYEQQRQFGFETSMSTQGGDDNDDNVVDDMAASRNGLGSNTGTTNHISMSSKMTGIDPLDEFLDGAFDSTKPRDKKTSTTDAMVDAPKCARHHRPCKLVVVKKDTTGNKGRKFYACSMPRGEQCNHFQWADDTIEVRSTNHQANHF
jgi:hypothetical protein